MIPGAAQPRRYRNLAAFAAAVIIASHVVVNAYFYTTALWPPDAWAYWGAWHGPLYDEGARLFEGGYIYSPAFAIPLWPFAQLPWPVFVFTWSAIGLATYAWLLKPIPLMPFRLPLLAACLLPVAAGNIEWLLALMLVIGGPAGWTIALLTKITPGLVGPAWYATRREWRNLSISIGVPLAIVLVSFAVAPGAWFAWVGVLADSVRLSPTGGSLMPPLFVRVPAALLLTVWAARTDRTWCLPLAMIVAQPDPHWTTAGILAALPRLATERWKHDPVLRSVERLAPVALAAAAVASLLLLVPELRGLIA